jgi:hypothetical protein
MVPRPCSASGTWVCTRRSTIPPAGASTSSRATCRVRFSTYTYTWALGTHTLANAHSRTHGHAPSLSHTQWRHVAHPTNYTTGRTRASVHVPHNTHGRCTHTHMRSTLPRSRSTRVAPHGMTCNPSPSTVRPLPHDAGGGTHGTHVAACTDAPPDPLNDTAYVCPPPSDGSKDFRGYDWFNGESQRLTNPTLASLGFWSTPMSTCTHACTYSDGCSSGRACLHTS